jgi:hypothetical protein
MRQRGDTKAWSLSIPVVARTDSVAEREPEKKAKPERNGGQNCEIKLIYQGHLETPNKPRPTNIVSRKTSFVDNIV